MGVTNLDKTGDELDVTALKIGGVSVTPSGAVAADQMQILTGNGAITIPNSQRKSVILNEAGAIAATLVAPAPTTDDGKELVIVSATAQAHTITLGSGDFNGGTKHIDTFSVVGDVLRLVAYNGVWYISQNTGTLS
jgi:hypothetical protein